MKSGLYAVVRCIPDLARGEAFNVGAVLWADDGYDCKVDSKAVERVVSQAPSLARGGLAGLAESISRRLAPTGSYDKATFGSQVERLSDGFLCVTEPRFVELEGAGARALDETLSKLIRRIVTPRKRPGRGFDPLQALKLRLRPQLKARSIEQDHKFVASRSGVPRQVTFFANSTVNAALDVLDLGLAKEGPVAERIDAEAFKVEDVLGENRVRFAVYCLIPQNEAGRRREERARRIFESVKASLVTDLDTAIRELTAPAT